MMERFDLQQLEQLRRGLQLCRPEGPDVGGDLIAFKHGEISGELTVDRREPDYRLYITTGTGYEYEALIDADGEVWVNSCNTLRLPLDVVADFLESAI